MHYTVDYNELTGQAKKDKALADIVEYCGQTMFDKLNAEFKKSGEMSFELFQVYASMAGVQGYPVKAWYAHLFGEKKED